MIKKGDLAKLQTKVYVLHFSFDIFVLGKMEEIAGVFTTLELAEKADKELQKEFKESDHLSLSTSILVFELDKLQNTE